MTTRHFVMVEPTYFDVVYEINPWMSRQHRPNHDRAMAQWNTLVGVYRDLGHRVDIMPGAPDLPDMVFAANGGISVAAIFYTPSFTFPERRPESALFAQWQREHLNAKVVQATKRNEGEGDLLVCGGRILAGWGFRSTVEAHAELSAASGLPVESLHLVDPRFYHLDTALCVLDEEAGRIAYFPGAFDGPTLERLRELYPEALEVGEDEAVRFAMNTVSDGQHVIHAAAATRFGDMVREVGYEPIAVDMSEYLTSGGGIKCCTMTIR